MLTTDDLSLLREVFATKQEFAELREQISHLPTKEEFFSRMDELVGELKTVRQEFQAHQMTHDDIDERLDAIEATQTVAHELRRS